MSVTAKGAQTGREVVGERRHRLRAVRGALEKLAQWAASVEMRTGVLISAIVVAYGLGSIAVLAMALENGTIALCAGAPAVAAWVAVVCLGEPPEEIKLDETGRGEIAKLSHEDFDRLVEEVEGSAAAAPARSPAEDDHFEQLVRDALDELPDFVQTALAANVAVVISDDGAGQGRYGYYGLYQGGTVAHDYWRYMIVIYRDTLVRAFGHDPEALRRNVEITVRHEVAHHLGASERRVAELGL